MKPKYQKPTLTSFPLANATAGGFEPQALCQTGTHAGQPFGDCSLGSGPGSTSNCYTGSAATGGNLWCVAGSNATSGCFTGTAPNLCGPGVIV
ncbi:MAG: hypothetical protein KKB51_23780 [Candidatus Riflebacteria bacterium]|nr:hypothetical protein [Candidatus Riflebacteria bacterium]